MTSTTQRRSLAVINGRSENNGEADEKLDLLLSIFDNLNELGEALGRLNYVFRRKYMERRFHLKDKGET